MQLEKLKGALPLFLLAASAASSWCAWTLGYTVAAAALPLLWWQARNRSEAMSIATVYYLAGGWTIPSSADAFFAESNAWFLGLCLWMASSLLLAAPWGLLRPYGWKGLLGAVFLSILPPLGLIGWCNPLLAASDIFPGWGMLGFGLLLVIFFIPVSRHKVLISAAVFALSLIANHAYSPRSTPISWMAVNTQLGKYPSDLAEQAYWQTQIANRTQEAIQTGAEVVMIPELIAGVQSKSMVDIWARELRYSGAKPSQMILVGGARPIDRHRYANSLFVWMDATLLGTVSARQTVPVSMWRPYAKDGTHFPTDWFKTNMLTIPLHGKPVKVATVFCYEELLTFPMLMTLASESPYAMISVVNGWWASPAEQRVQLQHISAWAKLFNLPLLRAVNSRAQ